MTAQMKRRELPTPEDRRREARLNTFKNIISNTYTVKAPGDVLRNTTNKR